MSGHGRRISSLSVTYQEEYHRPHAARKHTALKHHPFTKLGSSRVSKPHPSFVHGRDLVPGLIVPAAAVKPATPSTLAVPVPQLPKDQLPLEGAEFGVEDICDLPEVNMAAALPPPGECFGHPLDSTHGNSTYWPLDDPNDRDHMTGCHGNTPNPSEAMLPCSSAQWPPPPNYHDYYKLEDQLRHKINVEIENFRLSVQQTLVRQFQVFPEAAGLTHTHTLLDHHHPPGGYEKSDMVQQLDERDCNLHEGASSCNLHEEASSCNLHEGASSCASLHSNSELSAESANASVTGDSGVDSVCPVEEQSVDQQIDLCLIELLNCSLAMTNILNRRTEYSVL